MPSAPSPELARKTVSILYHSAAGGTQLVAELVAELLSVDLRARATSIYSSDALGEASGSDFVVFCYPTYFLRPSPSMREFIDRPELRARGRAAFLVTTYELYAENSLRACAMSLRTKGWVVAGSAAIRAPGSDLTCVIPDRLCGWLYRFEPRFPDRLRSIAQEIRARAQGGACRDRLPHWKWYTPLAQALQRGLLDGFIEWRRRIRILEDRCSDCDVCVSRCHRGAWIREGGQLRHDPERCELCTRCIHHCPQNAIVLMPLLRNNRRLDVRHFRSLEVRARQALALPGARSHAP